MHLDVDQPLKGGWGNWSRPLPPGEFFRRVHPLAHSRAGNDCGKEFQAAFSVPPILGILTTKPPPGLVGPFRGPSSSGVGPSPRSGSSGSARSSTFRANRGRSGWRTQLRRDDAALGDTRLARALAELDSGGGRRDVDSASESWRRPTLLNRIPRSKARKADLAKLLVTHRINSPPSRLDARLSQASSA